MTFSPGHIRTAIAIMRANRGRTLLTMFGIIIGVASVIVIVGISQGVKRQINNQVKDYSRNVITITSKATNSTSFGLANSVAVSTLTDADYKSIAKLKDVVASVPFSIVSGVATGDHSYQDGTIIATTPNLLEVLNQPLAFGSFFNDQAGTSSFDAVLGATAASKLFNSNVPLGYGLSIRGQQFTVYGVLNQFSNSPFSNDSIYNNAIFIPQIVAKAMTHQFNPIYQILVRVNKAKNLNYVDHEIHQQLLLNHGGQNNFNVLLPSQVAGSSSVILNLMTELTIGIAVIALVVGGIGIMNVMLVSVTERMHEIGIRKAIGASNKQILNQFLVESTTVSICGGIIGIILALIADAVLRLLTNLTPVISWQIIVIALVISVLIGSIFGSLPAYRASKKEPIDALRAE